MNKIERMLQELCPDGVEYKKLGEVCEIQRGVRVTKQQLSENGAYPVYQNSLIPLGKYDKSNQPAGTPFIIITRVRDKKTSKKVGNLANILYLYG